ncbi:MAG: hypothetical protein KC944_23565, partial [Candidatus Omnitrophica bacterium]|nr:hypothetical protein [Candidatus Omnitrophota bacterium]
WLAVVLLVATMAGATPDGPRFYYLGPKIDPGGDIDWAWPTGAMAGIDLSGATNNIAFYWSDHPISAPGSIYGGTDLARTMGAGAKAVWAASVECTIPPGAYTLLDMVWNTLNGWENTSGLNPIVPTSAGFKELWFPGHSIVRKEKWQGEFDDSYNRVRRLVRQSIKRAYLHGLDELQTLDGITLKELRDGVGDNPDEQKYIDAARRLIQNQRLTPAEAKAKIQDYIAKKYRQFLATQVAKLNLDWRDLVDAGVPMLGPVKPSTTYTDDFNRASLGAGWTSVYRTWSISSNRITHAGGVSGTQSASVRYESDLSSDDHYSQVDYTTTTDPQGYTSALCRFSTGSSTYYEMLSREASSLRLIRKWVSGSATTLDQDTGGTAPPQTMYVSADGSTIIGKEDGSTIFTVTDTAISGNLRCGIGSHPNNPTTGDNFVCEDILVSSPSTPTRAVDLFQSHVFRGRVIR